MSDLLVIGFDDEATGFRLRDALIEMQTDYLLELEDAVVVTRRADGVQLHQAVNLPAAGALGGGFWGALVGLIFLNPLVGIAVGAGSGALAGYLSDYGVKDDFMRDVGETLKPGGSAVFVLLRKITADKVLNRLGQQGFEGRVIQSSLSEGDELRLRQAMVDHSVKEAVVPNPDDLQTENVPNYIQGTPGMTDEGVHVTGQPENDSLTPDRAPQKGQPGIVREPILRSETSRD